MIIKFEGKNLECKVTHKNINNAYIKLDKNLKVEFILPLMGTISPEKMLEEKRIWLKRKIVEFEKCNRLNSENEVYYKGDRYPIKVIQDKETRIGFFCNKLEVRRFGKRKPEKIIAEFLEDETTEYVTKCSEELSGRLGVYPKSIEVKKMKKFGYCTIDGKIFFSSKLICLPKKLIDFVVCHELVHLKHFNHSTEFKSELENIFPDRKKLDKELKKYLF